MFQQTQQTRFAFRGWGRTNESQAGNKQEVDLSPAEQEAGKIKRRGLTMNGQWPDQRSGGRKLPGEETWITLLKSQK